MTDPCSFDGCDRDAERSGRCWGHYKQRQRGEELTPLAEDKAHRRSPLERLTEAALAYADAGDDEEFRRAADWLRKSAQRYQKELFSQSIRAAMAAAKARGVHVGRPRTVSAEQAAALAAHFGIRRAARMLGVSAPTVLRAMRAFQKARLCNKGAET